MQGREQGNGGRTHEMSSIFSATAGRAVKTPLHGHTAQGLTEAAVSLPLSVML